MPSLAPCGQPKCHGLIDFGVSERFAPAVVPSKTPKRGDPAVHTLLQVRSEAILDGGFERMIGYVWQRSLTILKLLDRYAIVPHIGVINVTQQPHRPFPVRQDVFAQFELDIFEASPTCAKTSCRTGKG